MTFSEVTRGRADELLRELVTTGEIERHKAEDWVVGVVRTTRHWSGAFISTVRHEVGKPFTGLKFPSVDDLARKGADTLSRSPLAHKANDPPKMSPATMPTAKKAARKVAIKKSAAGKTPTKRTKKVAAPDANIGSPPARQGARAGRAHVASV
jgi:hypothetical protein